MTKEAVPLRSSNKSKQTNLSFKKYVAVFVIHVHTTLHVPNSKGLLITQIKWETKYRFHEIAMLFSTLQKYNFTKIA
jgi:hypothetical protein